MVSHPQTWGHSQSVKLGTALCHPHSGTPESCEQTCVTPMVSHPEVEDTPTVSRHEAGDTSLSLEWCHTPALGHPHRVKPQGPIQSNLEHLQGCTGHPQALWAAVPAPHYSHRKELPPDIQPKSSLPQLQTISPCPAVISPFKEWTPPVCRLPLGTERLQ